MPDDLVDRLRASADEPLYGASGRSLEYHLGWVRGVVSSLREAADEIERLLVALDEIADGCRCTLPDQWAIGQCDCQTKIAEAALEGAVR